MTDVPTSPTQDWSLRPASWTIRRRVLIGAILFCGGCLSWILYRGGDSVLSQNALYVFSASGVTLIGQYVFGATWDDHSFRSAILTMRGQGGDH